MTTSTYGEIIAWAIQAGLDQEFWLAESHPNFDNEMRMLTAFAHLCRADLVAEIEGWKADQKENLANQCDLQAEINALRAELGQYPEIQAMLMSENKQLRAENDKLKAKVAERSAEYLAAHITYDKGYQEGRLDAIEMCAEEAEKTYDVFLREKPFLATPVDAAVAIRRLK